MNNNNTFETMFPTNPYLCIKIGQDENVYTLINEAYNINDIK